MRNAQRIATSGVVLLIASLPAWSASSDPNVKAAKLFNVKWSTIAYGKTVTIDNPEVSSSRRSSAESLQLVGQIRILDANLVLGTSREAVVTRLVDGGGREVNVPPAATMFASYESPQFTPRYTQPPQVPQWQAFVRSVLRLPPANAGFRPQLISELQPGSLALRLDVSLLKQPSEIRRVKGYFCALVADSTESVEVSFEPNNAWVRLTPDLEIQVQQAVCTGSQYQFFVETRGPQQPPMLMLRVGASLPGRLVVSQLLIGADGHPVLPRVGGMIGGIGGSSSGSSSNPVKALRFIIAVKPTERKIPFVFEHIPLPKP